MKKQVFWLGMVLLALAALPLAGGVGSGKARPFKAKSIVCVIDQAANPYEAVMYGQATHLGKFVGQFPSIQFSDAPEGPANEGTGILIAANGDSVTIHMVDYLVYMDESIAVCQGTYDIAGGTGRFLNASGHGSYTAIVELTNANPPEFTFDGTMVY
jgi:hypothetical protein